MMRTALCATALGVAAVCSGTAVAADHPLLCRGPVGYLVGSGPQFLTTVVSVPKNTTKAGNFGISLAPGTCAWADRPIASGEPSVIFWYTREGDYILSSFVAFTACVGNSRCVFEFMAHNADDASNPHYEVQNKYMRIYYPAFP